MPSIMLSRCSGRASWRGRAHVKARHVCAKRLEGKAPRHLPIVKRPLPRERELLLAGGIEEAAQDQRAHGELALLTLGKELKARHAGVRHHLIDTQPQRLGRLGTER